MRKHSPKSLNDTARKLRGDAQLESAELVQFQLIQLAEAYEDLAKQGGLGEQHAKIDAELQRCLMKQAVLAPDGAPGESGTGEPIASPIQPK